ncbi:MAG: hypothetical protein GXP08_03140 [Gammaproteobacteria bacterium]|nr:hypothetical protein [Gammaproteobacteria bacterium]
MISHSNPLLLLLILIVLTYQISACTGDVDIRQQKAAQDRWLEKNYPDEKYEAPQHAALQTEFYSDVIAGNVMIGMNLLEAQVTTKTYPHGNNRYSTVYWCDGRSVNECNNNCGICTAVLITDKTNYYLKGKGKDLRVVQMLAKRRGDNANYFKSKSYTVVNALFLNKIVPGMSVADFTRIRLLPTSKLQYYCNNQRIYSTCLENCGNCIIKIISARGNNTHLQTVHFKGHLGFKTIVDVKQSSRATVN